MLRLGGLGSPSFRGFLLACDCGEGVYCRYAEKKEVFCLRAFGYLCYV